MIELIEHLMLKDVPKIGETVFGFYQPQYVIVTTPNSDFNQHFVNLSNDWKVGQFRDDDHKYEWTQKEFQTWCEGISKKHPCNISILTEIKYA